MKYIFLACCCLGLVHVSTSQVDSSLFRRIPRDTSFRKSMNMDAVYNRPFLSVGKVPVATGGYVESDYTYSTTDGISEGHTFRIPRLTLFIASSLHRKIKFLTEVEFEDGGKEVSIEFASLDFMFHPLVNFRGGIVMNPIGAFNQNHDGPKWEFVERPVAMTQMLPATWSNVGFGLFGKKYSSSWAFGYELYLTNGFDESIITNTRNRTYLPAAKNSPERFMESSNGQPLVTGKVALQKKSVGEMGISYMGGVYNKFQDDGLVLDEKRRVDVVAVDFNTTIPTLKTLIIGEWAWVHVNVPLSYGPQYGHRQYGGFVDVVQPMKSGTIFGFNRSVLNAACRVEYGDLNVGKFEETGTTIGDCFYAVVPAVSFRPTPQTVIRINYRREWSRDIINNPSSRTATIQLGISSYF